MSGSLLMLCADLKILSQLFTAAISVWSGVGSAVRTGGFRLLCEHQITGEQFSDFEFIYKECNI